MHDFVRLAREIRAHFEVRFGPRKSLGRTSVENNLIVSLTSFPARIGSAWLAIESVFQQEVRPDRIVLVLSEEEFPDRKLPRELRKQMARGLEVLWTNANNRSYDKLLPVLKKYPQSQIVTVDDDKILPKNLLADLMDATKSFPDSIIGFRGWEILQHDGVVKFGKSWRRASLDTSPERVFLPGNAGILYPPNSLSPVVQDISTAMRIAPSSDDVWFWACSIVNGTPRVCLGGSPHVSIRGQKNTPALKDVNVAKNQIHFEAVVDFFDLRQWLLQATSDGE